MPDKVRYQDMTTETVTTDANTNNQTVNDALRNANGTAATTGTDTTTTQQAGETLTFDKWLGTQPDNIKDLLDDHVDGLKSALDSERNERKILAKQLKDLSRSADDGSELKKKIDELTNAVEATDTKASFYEDAHEAGVKNLRLAWLAVKEYDLMKAGRVDFTKLKTVAPELFGAVKTLPAGNAGNGNGQTGITKPDMNRAIRVMAGRQAA